MSTITFDSLKLSDKLKASGFTPEQAEAVVRVIAEAQDDLVTRKDLDIALAPLKTDTAVIKAEMVQIKWMLGLVLGGIIAILVKLLAS
jgi:UDP-N-acetyl-D-mannosaminuronate dehydrogenase